MTTARPLSPLCEFWLGRAGTGKTWGCLAAIAEELQRSPRGNPLILLVPEQATLQMEFRLVNWPGLAGGYTRARVFSFNHLAREAFNRAGGRPPRLLSDVGRLMLMRRALARCQARLHIFRGGVAHPGLVQALDAAILELQRYGWRPDELAAWSEQKNDSFAGEAMLARKLADLGLLWGVFEEELRNGGWEDPGRYFEFASKAVALWRELDGVQVWVDGFSTFTAQELAVLDALLSHASGATIALCMEAENDAKNATSMLAGRIFHHVRKTLEQLEIRLHERDWLVERKGLPEAGQPTRFSAAPALAQLEREQLSVSPRSYAGTGVDETVDSAIELIEAADRRAEVEAVARRIVRWCRTWIHAEHASHRTAYLWREVGVIARDLTPYENLIREVFAQFEIPYFLDRPRRMQGHPLVRLLQAALGVLRSNGASESVLVYLKAGLGPLDLDTVACLENHMLATDPRGTWWTHSLDHAPELKIAWERAAKPLQSLERRLRRRTNPAAALWRFIEDLAVAETLDHWIDVARAEGDEEEAQLHEQAWEQTIGWLEQLELLAEAEQEDAPPASIQARCEQLLDLLGALATTQARLIPPTLNQVTVGSVDRSRTPEVRAVCVLGLNEREFPRLWTPDPILGDAERERLSGAGRMVGPGAGEKRMHEQFLAYIALTRASERLVLSRPLLDDEGKASDPSSFFRAAAAIFPQAPPRWVGRAGHGESPELPLRPEEWALRRDEDLGLHPHDMEALDPAQRKRLEKASAAAADPARAQLASALAVNYWRSRATLRVTALERYGQCPFQFFLQQMLGLHERECAMLTNMDLGSIRHAFLEALFRELCTQDQLDWGEVDPAAADAVIDSALQALMQDPAWDARLGGSRLERLTLQGVSRDLKLFVRALRVAGRRGAFRQCAAEWSFGAKDELVVQVGDILFRIHGKVDRIDVAETARGPAHIVFDYKSGQRSLSFSRLLGGIDLQLLVYGMALSSHPMGVARFGGAFYWPLSVPLREVELKEVNATEIDESWFARRAPSGMFEVDLARFLDTQVRPSDSSPIFGFRLKQDGSLSLRGRNHWPPGSIERLLTWAHILLSRVLGEIVEGRIEAAPFVSAQEHACDHCSFPALCRRFEQGAVHERPLDAIRNQQEALAWLDEHLLMVQTQS